MDSDMMLKVCFNISQTYFILPFHTYFRVSLSIVHTFYPEKQNVQTSSRKCDRYKSEIRNHAGANFEFMLTGDVRSVFFCSFK